MRPEIRSLPDEERISAIGDILTLLYATPLALGGLYWLIRASDFRPLVRNEPVVLILGIMMGLFHHIRFFFIVEIRPNRYGRSDGSITGLALWCAIFLLGPIALWLAILWHSYAFAAQWRASRDAPQWGNLRNLALNLIGDTLTPLSALAIYKTWGGSLPIAALSTRTFLLAMGVLVINLIFFIAVTAGYMAFHAWAQKTILKIDTFRSMLHLYALAILPQHFAHPFGIFAAGLYLQNGWAIFLAFLAGMILLALLARYFSRSIERSRQQSRLLAKLEELGRKMISNPPELENLISLLEEHLPHMFPPSRLLVWTHEDQALFHHPPDWLPQLDDINAWLIKQSEVAKFLSNDPLPWDNQGRAHDSLILAPLVEMEGNQVIGGLLLELDPAAHPWDRDALDNLSPAVQTLAAQIASALHQAKIYSQTIEYQRVTEELRLAGRIQSSFLPYSFPKIPGWEFAVTLEPAGETAGDFFDIIPLPDGEIGIVIADVLDKGVGPALYMAISRTLIRTYALALGSQPEAVFFATNERILSDTQADLFVTAFYGVINPGTGEMVYCNAGHNPPYIFKAEQEGFVEKLSITGVPIGIEETTVWTQATTQIKPGDVLVLYTDGIPEAQNPTGDFFSEEAMLSAVRESLNQSAEELQQKMLGAVHQFVAEAPQFDDITLMTLKRRS
jgi:serine phosphatase RsbU (regulator of sigma subunit)